jgi:hypothetical protein
MSMTHFLRASPAVLAIRQESCSSLIISRPEDRFWDRAEAMNRFRRAANQGERKPSTIAEAQRLARERSPEIKLT